MPHPVSNPHAARDTGAGDIEEPDGEFCLESEASDPAAGRMADGTAGGKEEVICERLRALLIQHQIALERRMDGLQAHQELLLRCALGQQAPSGGRAECHELKQPAREPGNGCAVHFEVRPLHEAASRQSRTSSGSSSACGENQQMEAVDSAPSHGRKSFTKSMGTLFQAAGKSSANHDGSGTSPLRKWLESVMVNTRTEMFFAILIASNSIVIGAEVEYMARSPQEHENLVFFGVHSSYTVLFLLELLTRLWVQRSFFFQSSDWMWNILDVFVVVTSLLETGLGIAALSGLTFNVGSLNLSNFRIVRLLRIIRLGRTLRFPRILRFVSALRTLVYSIFATLRSLIWALILLISIMYLFGIIFTESAIDYALEGGPRNAQLTTYWGSLGDSMFTLFKSISGGLSWHEVVTPLGEVSSVLVWLFGVYIFFTYFAVLNVVTGVFCQSALETAENDPDLAVQNLVDRRQEYTEKVRMLFKEMDYDDDGLVTIEELQALIADPTLKAYFAALQIDTDDAWRLFKLIDTDKTGAIDSDEFVWGCMRLKGPAKATDVACLIYDNRQLSKRVSKVMHYMEAQFEHLHRILPNDDHLLRKAAAKEMAPR